MSAALYAESHVLVHHARRRFGVALVFLFLGVVYAITPVNLIPDVLGPVGWVDDLGVLGATTLLAGWQWWRMHQAHKAKAAAGSTTRRAETGP